MVLLELFGQLSSWADFQGLLRLPYWQLRLLRAGRTEVSACFAMLPTPPRVEELVWLGPDVETTLAAAAHSTNQTATRSLRV